MVKQRQEVYVCDSCGDEQSRWQGRCVRCGEWNTLRPLHFAARPAAASASSGGASGGVGASVQALADIDVEHAARLSTGFAECDRVLGGGLVPGSVILLGGPPGAGKSTLLLQLLENLQAPCLYVSGEESPQQLALRVQRLGLGAADIRILAETDIDCILRAAEKLELEALVVDSIQVMQSPALNAVAGGVAQVRECAARLAEYAKRRGVVLLMIGHVTKDGSLAGPRVLEHLVDCSLLLESSGNRRFRTLRGPKNRFGPADELGIFALGERGMREVKNPSAIFLSRGADTAPGSVVTVLWEGSRALLLEIQALVDEAGSGTARRLAVGLDSGRLTMLLAILHRHGGVELGARDVFLNAVGGVRTQETGADLAAVLAVHSSLRDRPLPRDLAAFGELGLSGEVRPVNGGQERLREAVKHGFRCLVLPAANMPKKAPAGVSLHGVPTLSAALEAVAGL